MLPSLQVRQGKEVRLKALNVNLDLKVSGNAPEGATSMVAHKCALETLLRRREDAAEPAGEAG